MARHHRPIVCVIAGDPLTSPEALLQHLRAYWRRVGILELCEDVYKLSLRHICQDVNDEGLKENETALLHITFELLTSPPQTLVTGVDILLLLFSPAHPLSFLHLWEVWWPMFVHLRRLPIFLLATHMELLVMPDVQRYMHERGIQPINLQELTCAVQATTLSLGRVIPVSLGDADLLHANTLDSSCKSLVYLSNSLMRIFCATPGDGHDDALPLQLRWEATLNEASAVQLEAQLRDKWVAMPSARTGRIFYSNRITGEVTTVQPAIVPNDTSETFEQRRAVAFAAQVRGHKKASNLGSSHGATVHTDVMKNLQYSVRLLYEKRARLKELQQKTYLLRSVVQKLREETGSLSSDLEKLRSERASLVEKISITQQEFQSFQTKCELIGSVTESHLASLYEEINHVKRSYLQQWNCNKLRRSDVRAMHLRVEEVVNTTERLRQQITEGSERTIRLLQKQYLMHHNEITEIEEKSLLFRRWQALRGRERGEEPPNGGGSSCCAGDAPTEWVLLLRGLLNALLVVVEPLLCAIDRLQQMSGRLTAPCSVTVQATHGMRRLLLEERLQRWRIEVECTLDYASCIVSDFLLPMQRRGRLLGEHAAALLKLFS
ncbi:hypothetical protein ECC02_004523 [Trypanosoma cruzi]|uniref:Uncharacterized protein n=1 Tax=Trypanosoma cruzi TaxID=5693 RepID=A0A7J6Y7E5_TRYCR|nr:hypothetical protein ECC02_004523 [Trypanosoma cruzi]